jgi:hypothetical protein
MDNAAELDQVVGLMEAEGVTKFYFSHLNYAGRGNKNRLDDASVKITRDSMDYLFDIAWAHAAAGREREFVTGNNDADGPYFLSWVKARMPDKADHIAAKLVQWGGNASGVNVANIDNLGDVHPDTMWWNHKLGNVRQRPFSAIWVVPLFSSEVHEAMVACSAAIWSSSARMRACCGWSQPGISARGCWRTDSSPTVMPEPSACFSVTGDQGSNASRPNGIRRSRCSRPWSTRRSTWAAASHLKVLHMAKRSSGRWPSHAPLCVSNTATPRRPWLSRSRACHWPVFSGGWA